MKWHAIFVQRSLDALQPSMSDPSEGEKKCGEVIYDQTIVFLPIKEFHKRWW